MPYSITIEENVVSTIARETAVQTVITGSTFYSLPRWTVKQNMGMMMDEDGPLPMSNMRPTKKMRNAVDQFYDEHHGEYEAMGQGTNQVERVHNHNNASPKMYDELDKRRSIARVGMTGLVYQMPMRGTPSSSSENMSQKSDPTCSKCIKRKKRMDEEDRKRRRRLCKKCRDLEQRRRREYKNNLGRVTKQNISKPRKQQSRYTSLSRTYKPCIIRSNKGFQCPMVETKSVSTSKSALNLSSMVSQDITTPTNCVKDIINQEKNVVKSKSAHKKRPASEFDGCFKPDTESVASRTTKTSYNSFNSMEHEPMVE